MKRQMTTRQMAAQDVLINVRDLAFRYAGGGARVLDGINLVVRRGEAVGIFGKSGSGKSTLCLCLAGVIPARQGGEFTGDVKILGRSTREMSLSEAARYVGIVFQDPDTQVLLGTVEDEVAFAPENLCLPAPEIEDRVTGALDAVGISELRHANPAKLSGGQKHLVAIACALALDPQVLVLDEVLSHLDPVGRELVRGALMRLRGQGRSLVLVDHEPGSLAGVDRVLVLDGGKVVIEGRPEAVFGDKASLTALGLWADYPSSPGSRALRGADRVCLVSVRDLWFAYPATGSGGRSETQRRRGMEAICLEDPECPGKCWALRGVSVEVRRGEIVGLTGPNGSGKTTLSKCIAGVLRPARGTVLLDGRPADRMSLADIGGKVGYVFQNPERQFFADTALDEVAFAPGLRGVDAGQARKAAERILSRVGLTHLKDAPTHSLSEGEKRRLAIGAVLSMEPEGLVLDEPTTGLDRVRKRELGDILRDLAAGGSAVMAISHDLDFLQAYADRIITMDRGRVTSDERNSA